MTKGLISAYIAILPTLGSVETTTRKPWGYILDKRKEAYYKGLFWRASLNHNFECAIDLSNQRVVDRLGLITVQSGHDD